MLKLIFQVKFSAKLDPDDFVTFNLRYEELLERSDGTYSYEINVQPDKTPITSDGIDIKIIINETLPLKDMSIKRVFQKPSESRPSAEYVNKHHLFKTSSKSAYFNYTYSPPALDQVHNGNIEKIVINYDVKRPDDGNDIQIGAGRFVHYFLPDPNNVNKQPKHVIFVIDKSGSMNGTKMEQTKDAVMEWLQTMKENYINSFNFVMFDYSVNYWRGK
jgi:hypothetical protein